MPMIRRRQLLLSGAALLAGCMVEDPRSGVLGRMGSVSEWIQRGLFRQGSRAAPTKDSDLTPLAEFPQYRIGDEFPQPPSGWQLEVGGMVAHPARFSLEDLQRLPRTDLRVRHHCVEGWSAVASWSGVSLAALAALVQPDPKAQYVEFVSFESAGGGADDADDAEDAKALPGAVLPPRTYTSSWDRPSALHPQSILAYGMDGLPLPLEHGGPLRLYSAVKLGYKMVKWLQAVRFLPQPTGGYWEDQGYEWFAGV